MKWPGQGHAASEIEGPTPLRAVHKNVLNPVRHEKHQVKGFLL